MSPYNILKQNLVFDIPIGLTLEQLQVSHEIDFTFSFLRKQSNGLSTTFQSEFLPLDTKISDLADDGDAVLELLVSDKKGLPANMTKT